MDYSQWSEAQLKHTPLKKDGHTTSVWQTSGSDLPLLVLLHGISGDYSGLVPLAQELAKDFRLAIVELPGHGKSDPTPLPGAPELQRWFNETLELIEAELGEVAAICAHCRYSVGRAGTAGCCWAASRPGWSSSASTSVVASTRSICTFRGIPTASCRSDEMSSGSSHARPCRQTWRYGAGVFHLLYSNHV